MAIVGDYLRHVLSVDNLIRHSQNVVDALKPYSKAFDSIAFRGMSGAIIAPMVAAQLNKDLIMIRKSEDKSHASATVEGHITTQSYVIIDDFVDSGRTLRLTVQSINTWKGKAAGEYYLGTYDAVDAEAPAKCFAVVLYLADYQNENNEHLLERYYPKIAKALSGDDFLLFTTMGGSLKPIDIPAELMD